ncbi:histidine kinase [Spirillospora sp. NPDC047279]|uniref:sensor histidine kinase n=1 Tax=Spirillospora sp. NPDC047279 TaxID=3155478 RepID=UPI0033EC1DF2
MTTTEAVKAGAAGGVTRDEAAPARDPAGARPAGFPWNVPSRPVETWRPDRTDVGLSLITAAFGVCDSLTQSANNLLGDRRWEAALVTGLAGLLLLFRRRLPITVALACGVVHMIAFAPVHVVLSLYAAGAYSAVRARVIAVTAAVGALTVAGSHWDPGGSVVRGLMWSSFYMGATVIGMLSRRYTAASQAYADALVRERGQLVERARIDERARIARELHDVVAHRVSLMVVEAGALETSPERGADWTVKVAGRIRAGGRKALEELRQVVGVLDDEAPDGEPPLSPRHGASDIRTLVDGAREAGMDVTFTVDGTHAGHAGRDGHGDRGDRDERDDRDLERVPAAVGGTAYRIAQEALTNICKHAGRPAVRVWLQTHPERLVVRVVNDPPRIAGTGARLPGLGTGLIGLQERVESLGGVFAAHPHEGGFVVTAVLPFGGTAAVQGRAHD